MHFHVFIDILLQVFEIFIHCQNMIFRKVNFPKKKIKWYLENHAFYHQSVLHKSRSFTANAGTKVAVLPKAGFHCKLRNQGCSFTRDNFPLLSAPHSLFSIWTDLKISQNIPGGTSVEARRVDLANWALRTSPKFTTGVKYQFHQGFWSDQRFGNPNHPSGH